MKEKIVGIWNSKSEEDRRKIIVFSAFGLLIIIFVLVAVATFKSDKNKKVDEIGNPDAKEAQKYNTRTEANQMGKVDSTKNFNTAIDEVFGSSQPEQQNYDAGTYSQPTYENAPPPTQPTYTQPDYSAPKNSGGYNSHNTYGDYSMWQSDEPKNNSIEYTEVKNYSSSKKQPKNSVNNGSSYEEVTSFTQPSYGGTEKKLIQSQGTKVRAKMVSTGYATNGRSLSFVLLDPVFIAGEQTKKGQVITGNAVINGDRIIVKFGNIKINGKTLPANAFLLGYDGEEGLPVRGSSNNNSGANEDYIRTEAQNQANKIPIVGGLISRMGSGNRSSSNDSKIQLTSNVECTIQFN